MVERPNCSYDGRHREFRARATAEPFEGVAIFKEWMFRNFQCVQARNHRILELVSHQEEKDEIHPAQRDDRGKVAFAFEFSDGTQPGLGPA
jgi:hypothetical protein